MTISFPLTVPLFSSSSIGTASSCISCVTLSSILVSSEFSSVVSSSDSEFTSESSSILSSVSPSVSESSVSPSVLVSPTDSVLSVSPSSPLSYPFCLRFHPLLYYLLISVHLLILSRFPQIEQLALYFVL